MKERPVVESHSSQSRSSIGGAVGCCGGGDDVMIVIIVVLLCRNTMFNLVSHVLSKFEWSRDESRHIFLEKQKEKRESDSFGDQFANFANRCGMGSLANPTALNIHNPAALNIHNPAALNNHNT